MNRNSKLYIEVTPSSFAWEREAIDFVREALPDHEPYRLWSNFEFIAGDGSINEVDLLAATPAGVFLIEIKSRPGEIRGDQQSLEWHGEHGRIFTADNPLLLANRKAKKLKSLLAGTKAYSKVAKLPFIAAKVFLSHESNKLQGLDEHVRQNIHLRDISAELGGDRFPNGRPGIVRAIMHSEVRRLDKPAAKALTRALEEIGLRQAQGTRRINDYRLDELLYDTAHYQDWSAKHTSLDSDSVRVRIYQVDRGATEEERGTTVRAAKREFTILQGIEHEGILRARQFTEHECGPALVFEHYPKAQRLDHYLRERGTKLGPETRLHLLRLLAETVGYAHEKKLFHRALSPQCVLVLDPEAIEPSIKIFNWQMGMRSASTTMAARPTLFGISGTRHVGDLVEDQSLVYIAPEVHTLPTEAGEQADVFSLGAIAYHLFANRPPAENLLDLQKIITETGALDLAGMVDGINDQLDDLVDQSTKGNVAERLGSASEFLLGLEAVEDALTAPDPDFPVVTDPTRANKGDRLDHGLTVERRLGKGSSAVALLVKREGENTRCVLKVALDPGQNDRLAQEASALRRLRSPRVVELYDELKFGPRSGLLMQWAVQGSLAERIRINGAEQPEMLERFGNDLLEAVAHLEERGISHRDIKPENLGVVAVGRGDERHLVLFDFSLTLTPAENTSAGTAPYLDPFLQERKRWDVHAERFAAAVTLYQLATGTLPQWGDGQSAPWAIEDEVTLEPELFVPALREQMVRFFGQAFRRDYKERFGTVEELRQAWGRIFVSKPREETQSKAGEITVDDATLTTPASVLASSARGLHALERAGVQTVEDWLRIPLSRLTILRGVGSKTRRELLHIRTQLHKRFPEVQPDPKWSSRSEPDAPVEQDVAAQTVDELAAALWPKRIDKRNQLGVDAMRLLLGLDSAAKVSPWPSQSEVADAVGVTRARVGQVLHTFRRRWLDEPSITVVRDDLERILSESGGVMVSTQLADALVTIRGSVTQGDDRRRVANAVVRAALEAESERADPRLVQRRPRSGLGLFIALHDVNVDGTLNSDGNAANDYARRLGVVADEIATADPLLAPDRVLERLQAVDRPSTLAALNSVRLRELAVAASENAALSWRQEVYPKKMTAERALTLALGSVSATRQCTEQELRERVAARYPMAEQLPSRPKLDGLLKNLGSGLVWSAVSGRYEQPTDLPTSYQTSHTKTGPAPAGPTDDAYERKEFERVLRASLADGRFLALNVSTRRAEAVRALLAEHFDIDVVDLDGRLLVEMRAVADGLGPKVWDTVRKADVERPNADEAETKNWRNLRTKVVDFAVPRLMQALETRTRSMLLVYPGLLARYGRLDVVERLMQPSGPGSSPRAIWLLVAGDGGREHPKIDGQPLPLYQNSQWVEVPSSFSGPAARTTHES